MGHVANLPIENSDFLRKSNNTENIFITNDYHVNHSHENLMTSEGEYIQGVDDL